MNDAYERRESLHSSHTSRSKSKQSLPTSPSTSPAIPQSPSDPPKPASVTPAISSSGSDATNAQDDGRAPPEHQSSRPRREPDGPTYLPKRRKQVSKSLPKSTQIKETEPAAAEIKPTPSASNDVEQQQQQQQQQTPAQGSLADNSIFAEENRSALQTAPDGKDVSEEKAKPEPVQREAAVYSSVLNPRPDSRLKWQRKMVVRSVRRRGRLTKEERLLRTERSSLSKSHFFKTSIKKLAPLARQIAGKPIDEAILQMQYSKKKAARDVLKHLMNSKNEAIVRSGMGLGLDMPSEDSKPEPASSDSLPAGKKAREVAYSQNSQIISPRPLRKAEPPLRTEASKVDPFQVYISQAWVNRGPYTGEVECRAMGRSNLLRHPSTGLSVLLKEERTRMREQREKQEKKERQRRKVVGMGDGGMWTPMPDRKVVGPQSGSLLW
ncbi:MAG: hypothetical protein Q9227_001360 [Pyrenula ochraceoflavens]